MLNVNTTETITKTYTTNGTLYSYTMHLNQRMSEREISEIDLTMALTYGQKFNDPSGYGKAYSILHIDECDYEGQMTNKGNKATYIVVCHAKNKNGKGRVISTAFYDDENGGKIKYNIFNNKHIHF